MAADDGEGGGVKVSDRWGRGGGGGRVKGWELHYHHCHYRQCQVTYFTAPRKSSTLSRMKMELWRTGGGGTVSGRDEVGGERVERTGAKVVRYITIIDRCQTHILDGPQKVLDCVQDEDRIMADRGGGGGRGVGGVCGGGVGGGATRVVYRRRAGAKAVHYITIIVICRCQAHVIEGPQEVFHRVQDEDGALVHWRWKVGGTVSGRYEAGGRWGGGGQGQRLCVTLPPSSFVVVKLTSLMAPRKSSTVSRMKVEEWQMGGTRGSVRVPVKCSLALTAAVSKETSCRLSPDTPASKVLRAGCSRRLCPGGLLRGVTLLLLL